MYEYVAGKADWLAAGLPSEGTIAGHPTAGSVANLKAPTCRLMEHVGEVRARAERAGFDVCVVVNAERVVLGFMRSDELASPDDMRAEDAMRPGPSTYRPDVAIATMAETMTERDLDSVPITTSDGRLVGVLFRKDAVRAAKSRS